MLHESSIRPLASFGQMGEYLRDAVAGGRLGQAYIISADSAEVEEGFAQSFLQLAVCTSRLANGDACTQCLPCQKYENGGYGSVFELHPMSKTRLIRVADLKSFQNHFYLKTAKGQMKIGLIYHADRMNEEAQNAFLKTLEEPPEDSLFLLLTGRPKTLLPTIQSRCQQVFLYENRIQYPSALLELMSAVFVDLKYGSGVGSALKSLAKFQDVLKYLSSEAETRNKVYKERLAEGQDSLTPAQRNHNKELVEAQFASEYRLLRDRFFDLLETWISQWILCLEGVEQEQLPHPEFFEYGFRSEGQKLDVAQQSEVLQALEQLRWDLEGNVNDEQALEDFAYKFCQRRA